MTNAHRYLEIVRSRGIRRKPLRKVYRNMRNEALFLMAYSHLYANNGATTPGVDCEDTVDGMSVERIRKILKDLEEGRFTWKPVKRTYIEKKFSSALRPLGIPSWTDKLVQEVIRMILEAYYEPQFRPCSHGFRPNKGCHTALTEIYRTWAGVKWFIETDIKGCFETIDHDVLTGILRRHIEDERFLKLIRGMLKAGYVDGWEYHRTYSGTPQGGIVSPLLANIMLHEVDVYIEDVLIPNHTRGTTRKSNTAYQTARQRAIRAKKRGDRQAYKDAKTLQRSLPVGDPMDSEYARLRYVRYADDSLFGFIGTKAEAEQIKCEVRHFCETLKLAVSDEKTLITHARTGKARFLNYLIGVIWDNAKIAGANGRKIRGRNGQIILTVPEDVPKSWIMGVKRERKIIRHRCELQNNSDYDIIMSYESKVQGLINYYELAHDVYSKMSRIRYVYKESLLKTLAAKHHTSSTKIAKKYRQYTADGRKIIAVTIERKQKPPLVASYGRKPIRQNRNAIPHDEKPPMTIHRTELLERLLHSTCEVCGEKGYVEGHHIRKLKDLRRSKEKPKWAQIMIAMKRKTLFVCKKCHTDIHAGRYDGAQLTQFC